jgi:hypothetical protein
MDQAKGEVEVSVYEMSEAGAPTRRFTRHPRPRTVRGACRSCGAHASCLSVGPAVWGQCPVCGGHSLTAVGTDPVRVPPVY